MDRDNNYDRVKLAYDALTKGEGQTAASGPEAIQQSYDKDETDEFVKPTVVMENGAPVATIKDNDSVVFFNFRPTVQERSPDASAMMISRDLTEVQELRQPLYALPITIRRSRINLWHFRRLP